jgi:hypothetical protein
VLYALVPYWNCNWNKGHSSLEPPGTNPPPPRRTASTRYRQVNIMLSPSSKMYSRAQVTLHSLPGLLLALHQYRSLIWKRPRSREPLALGPPTASVRRELSLSMRHTPGYETLFYTYQPLGAFYIFLLTINIWAYHLIYFGYCGQNVFIIQTHAYHSRFIPEGEAEVSLKFLRHGLYRRSIKELPVDVSGGKPIGV